MNKDTKFIIVFAASGLFAAVLMCLFTSSVDIFDISGALDAVLVFCLAFLLSFVFGGMKSRGAFFLIWTLIAFGNAGMYAIIGAAIVGLRRRHDFD